MKVGKVPAVVLQRLLAKIQIQDPRVLLGPRIGEDAALIDLGDKVLVAKTDPITFATDLIGWYAVQVNANDVACRGVRPHWFLATLLLPEGFSQGDLEALFDQVLEACNSLDVTLVGGHSEITAAVDHPIVVGCMLGEGEKDAIVRTSGAQVGDSIVLTKGIAIEGSALLARQEHQALQRASVKQETIARAQEFLFSPGISVVRDAMVACASVQVHSLHDPTEGGLATGLWEVAQASGKGLVVDMESITLLPECLEFCRALEMDPLGLLASGALLICLPPTQVPTLLEALAKEGVQGREIGRITWPEEGVLLHTKQGVRPLPTFERDELARYFDR